jgi:hypothetical protein
MPKVVIDYSNTIIYKIFCKDPLIKDLYVGHTTNFVQRKYAHKQSCNNIKSPCYNVKLYKTIRLNGNWSNWDMVIVQFYNCKDHLEARQKEQEHFISLNATLNSIEPLPFTIPSKINILSKNYNNNNKYHSEPSSKKIDLDYNDTNSIFFCKNCDYTTSKKSSYDKHLLTTKHNIATEKEQIVALDSYKCICGKNYKDNSGLWRHKKTCLPINQDDNNNNKQPETNDNNPLDISDKEIIKMLIHECTEFKNLILDQNKTIIELSKNNMNITNNTNNNTNTNNSHNKTFNLQFFLNEECKDALNISEFVSSIKVELEDLEATGRLGYVEGVSRIMNKNLKELDISKRPIHCSDLKREVVYIKNDDQWTKEEEAKPILKKAIKQVAFENIKMIGEWRKKYPGCMASDSRKNDLYLKIVGNAMSGLTTEEQLSNIDKIVSKVAKEAVIDKINEK